MSPSTLVPQADIRRLLTHCAPGFRIELRKHRYWVHYGGKTFRGLGKGAHGDRRQHVPSGDVVQMVTHLDIDPACANKQLPILNLRYHLKGHSEPT